MAGIFAESEVVSRKHNAQCKRSVTGKTSGNRSISNSRDAMGSDEVLWSERSTQMSGTTGESGTMRYAAREVVGAFPSAGALETAVEQLEVEGVNRAAISVLGVDAARSAGSTRSIARPN